MNAARGPKFDPRYLNNLFEQDRRSIKLRLYPMLGLKRSRSASITIAGIELMIGSGMVSSDLASLASKAKRPPKSGMMFSLHDPRRPSKRFVALIPQIAPLPCVVVNRNGVSDAMKFLKNKNISEMYRDVSASSSDQEG